MKSRAEIRTQFGPSEHRESMRVPSMVKDRNESAATFGLHPGL